MPDKRTHVSPTQVPKHLRGERSRFAQWFGRTLLQLGGWRVEGEIPNVERLLICAAPHTSNWDFVWGMAAILGMNAKVRWIGKHSIFKPGVRRLMTWLGGISVDRSQPKTVVEDIAKMVERDNGVVIVVTPEGTRKKVARWKTGFLRIADAADCTILLGALDFPSKRIILGEVFQPSGDNEADIVEIKDYYRQFTGRRPELF